MNAEGIVWIVLMALFIVGFALIPRKKRTKIVGCTIVLVALLAELFVANFHSFHLLGGNYEETAIDLEAETVHTRGFLGEDGLISNERGWESAVTIKDINAPVGTVEILCKLPSIDEEGMGTPYVDVWIDAKDETNSADYRYSVADGKIIRGDDRTAVILLDLTGEVDDLCIRFRTKEGASFELLGITLNRPVPFRLSVLRSLLLILPAFAIFALATFPCMREAFEKKKLLATLLAMGLTLVLMLSAVALTFAYQYDRTEGVISPFDDTVAGNQITAELPEAFANGQVSLIETPSEELLALENPYDWSQRNEAGIYYLWDHLLFEGKYYSYYGIAPVMLLFLPYYLITGNYFPTPEAVLLFGGLGILFLSLLFLEFCKIFCKKIPVNILLSSLVILQLSSGVWYNFCSPLFYEIAQTSGFLFTTAGFFFLLRARLISEGKIRFGSLIAAGFCLAAAVLCRPTLALYCVTALPFIAFGFFKLKKRLKEKWSEERGKRFWGGFGYLAAALGFFALFGGAQMWYNWARFGSPLDFGIQYSLTINDFTRAQYHTDFVMIGLYNFLVAFPSIRPDFPYVFSNYSSLDTNGYYFLATNNAGGMLWRALPTFGYFGVGKAHGLLQKGERSRAWLLWLPVCIIAPLVILFSIWESGYAVRYCTDFAWQMVLGGMGILYLLYSRWAHPQTKTILERFFIISAILAVVVNGALVYGFISRQGYLESAYLSFERLFDFWK